MQYIQHILKQKYFYLVLAFIPVIFILAGMYSLSVAPYTGLHFEYRSDSWSISSIDNNSPASEYREQLLNRKIISIGNHYLQKHDLITTFDKLDSFFGEYELMKEAYTDFNSDIQVGQPTVLQIVDNGVVSSVSIISSAFPPGIFFGRLGPGILISLSLIIMGLVVVWKKAYDIRVVLYFLITFSLSIIAISIGIFNSKDIYFPFPLYVITEWAARIAFYYFIAIFLHFCIVFPEDNLKYNKALIIPLYIIVFLLLISFQYNVLQWFNRITGLILVLASIGITVYKYFIISSVKQRTQIKIIIFGIISAMLVFITFYIIPVILWNYRAIDQIVMLLIAEIIPISIFVAIRQHKLMDIDTLFDNTLIYLGTLAVFVVIDIIFIYIMSVNHFTTFGPSDLWWVVAGVWFIIFSYIPVRNTVQLWVKRLLKREIYDTDKVIIAFQQKLLLTSDITKVAEVLRETIDNALHPRRIVITSDITPAETFYDIDNNLMIPIRGLSGQEGVIELSKKYSDNLYTKEDIRLVETLANMGAIVIESIRTREKAVSEKQEISREIHDNIGHSLIMARYMASEAGSGKGKELGEILDNGLQELREVLSLADGEKQILADFIESVYQKSEYFKNNEKIKLAVETVTWDENIEISYQIRSNLMKIIQEALSNAIKYSGCDSIKIIIKQERRELYISVSDNGKGFDTSQDMPVKHHGLKNMARRAEAIGAEFSVTSGSGAGVRVEVCVRI